ncbi:MAG: radical SAM protein [Bacteroidales bacterium]|nr:radical SAM protein [Bacteroidales bacterium]
MERRIFGPVPSRRLGKSLGVNNIPHKICTYQCLYCQIGKAIKMQVNRQEYFKPEDLVNEVKTVLSSIKNHHEYPDYITIVPDGEPTLDSNLGELIEKLKDLKLPVAVITNASLINLPDVQRDLLKADYVSVKADTFNTETWKKINIPHKNLNLNEIRSGISSFARQYTGKLVTETMLVKGINDSYNELENTARFVKTFEADTAYIAIPTRPPAFKNIQPSDEGTVIKAYHVFKEHVDKVELLTGYEGNAFSSTGNFREDILSITAVHPMREDAVLELLHKTNDNNSILALLIEDKLIEKLQYNGHNYFLRKFRK